ncbi:MAG: metallophosphoesterase [Actinobacteria bacterium]|uniref:Metallophosphoesterase n=1 Tax=Candidatus Fonsibacter lacus TaxID=2576439 RepID=A0A965LKU6_9PROT|nr:metallophosphoesterase [Candidatus Fonsibacter lacus]
MITLHEVELPLLASGEPLSILHLSDLHITPNQKRKLDDLRELSLFEVDFTVITGDFLAHHNSVPVVLDALSGLLSRPGAFVFGSNDYYGPKLKNPLSYLMRDHGVRKLGEELPWQRLCDGLSERGWLDLNQSKRIINLKNHIIEFRGTDDAHLNRDNYSLVAGGKDARAELSIGVTHAPYKRILDAMAKDGVDLIFAGHTHGGQVRLPLPSFLGGSRALTTNCDLPHWRARGLSIEDGKPWLHVSAGIGTNPFTPFRVGTRPEASVVTLTTMLS